jgi:hypothetical protein
MRQPKVVLKVSQVPDWGRRAIRLSLALIFFTTIAITLWPVPGTVVQLPCIGLGGEERP